MNAAVIVAASALVLAGFVMRRKITRSNFARIMRERQRAKEMDKLRRYL